VRTEAASIPDWRDPERYAALLDADRALLAWEWLRRDPAYRSAADAFEAEELPGAVTAGPEAFGLAAFEAADCAVPDARPIWRAEVHPLVLAARPGAAGARCDLFDVARFSLFARLVTDEAADRLLLSDGLRSVRIDARPGTFGGGPVHLNYELGGIMSAEPPLLTLRRFLALARTGGFSRVLHPAERRARRWILLLRAWDGVGTGADQREIARVRLSRSAGEPGWRSREPSVRSQVQRLVRSARAFARGGYRRLLD
jgi:hypothetical protein